MTKIRKKLLLLLLIVYLMLIAYFMLYGFVKPDLGIIIY